MRQPERNTSARKRIDFQIEKHRIEERKKQQKIEQQRQQKERRREKQQAKELKDFYRFQLRETKREQLAKPREQFEEDKKRIERMQAFRPI